MNLYIIEEIDHNGNPLNYFLVWAQKKKEAVNTAIPYNINPDNIIVNVVGKNLISDDVPNEPRVFCIHQNGLTPCVRADIKEIDRLRKIIRLAAEFIIPEIFRGPADDSWRRIRGAPNTHQTLQINPKRMANIGYRILFG